MLTWNVYVGDFNTGKIELYNIFNHHSFYNDCVKAKKKFKDDKEGFAEEVRRDLHYYFWAKCEWEIILDHWPDGEYDQLRRDMTAGEFMQAFPEDDKKYYLLPNPENKITVKCYPKNNRFCEKKIDVCEQVMNNWDIFIDWLWDHRSELKARK